MTNTTIRPRVVGSDETDRAKIARTRKVSGYFLLATVIGAVVFLLTCSCAGTAARDNVLMPAIAQAWPGVKADAERGIAVVYSAGPAPIEVMLPLSRLDRAIFDGNRALVNLTDWLQTMPFTEQGISDRLTKGEIGPNVANSLRKRVQTFDEAIRKLKER